MTQAPISFRFSLPFDVNIRMQRPRAAERGAMGSSVLVLCSLALFAGLRPAGAQTCDGGDGCYTRATSRARLPESHTRLARAVDAGPHSPEQVHLAFAGPASYAVTWMTHPLDDPKLANAVEQPEGQASRRLAATAAGGAAAAAELQHHIGAVSAAANDQPQLESLEKKHRRRRRRSCSKVVAAGGRSVVEYGTQPDEYEHTVESSDPVACYSSGAYVSGAIHRVQFGAGDEGPLPPNTTVFYRVGDPDRGWSRQYSFRTAPLVGEGALPYRLGLVGDLGQTDHSLSTLEHLLVSAPDSVILTGDLSYADGFQPYWDTWQRLVEPHTATQVWMYTVGNHEIELTNGVKDFLSYETRFYFPYRQSLSTSKLVYSYDVAGAHIIMLSSYSPYNPASEQYAWLVHDLASVDRARTPWVVVVMHAPWYNSNYAHQGEGDAMRDSMESLLYEHGVDFVFAGHVHAYERHHRVFKGKLDDCAPIYINIGDGGNKEGPDKKYYPQPKYTAYREPSFGHGTLDLVDATHAEWRWHRNQDDGPSTADSTSIVRNPDCKSRMAAARLAESSSKAASSSVETHARDASLAAPQQAEQQRLVEVGYAARRTGQAADTSSGAAQSEQQQQDGEQHQAGHSCLWRRAIAWLAHFTRQFAL